MASPSQPGPPRIGVVSLSSPVGRVELDRGLDRLRRAGFADVVVHPAALARSFVTAGTDDQRAGSLLDYAYDDAVDVVWCARGGYGAARLLPLLAAATAARGRPRPKLLVGYSDVTVLHEYVRAAWGWRTLHAPMVAATSPGSTPAQWAAVDAAVRGEPAGGGPARCAYESPCLRWLANPPAADVVGEVVGGNLSLWASLAGTPWQPDARGKILFLEDVGERLYRLDRMAVQVEQSGMFDGAAAVVLGDFTDCDDETHWVAGDGEGGGEAAGGVAADGGGGKARVPLRPTVPPADGLDAIFGRVARRLGFPLAAGLPVGHGPNYWPLRLGERHRLTVAGALLPHVP